LRQRRPSAEQQFLILDKEPDTMSFRRVVPFALLLAGCGSDPASEGGSNPNEYDVRVEIPAPDPAFIDFVSAEALVMPGEEKMLCTHFRHDGEEMAFSTLKTHQGDFGHHAVLLGAKEPLEPGTTEDCTDKEDMARFDAYTIGDQELPPGHGIHLPANKAMVLQAHYVNTGAKPIRIRDVVRMQKMPIEEVTTWAAIHITNTLEFSIPPRQTGKKEFECPVEKDVDLLVLGGHMHELGAKFEFFYTEPGAKEKSLYLADPWKPEYRDLPPVTLFFNEPLKLKAGGTLRTVCEWTNMGSHEIAFPEEMCTAFGYAAGSKEPIVCNSTTGS
jgi:hypothetical protein